MSSFSSSYTPGHRRPLQLQRHLSVSIPLLLVGLSFASTASFVDSHRYNVGGLRCWGPPSPSNPHFYSTWSEKHDFKIGDSLMFLYPPSQDSLLQVSKTAFDDCDLSDPILKIDDGNSVVNLTSEGVFYFASGRKGRCADHHQKLAVKVLLSANGSSEAGAPSPSSSAASFPMVFGPSALPSASAASSVAIGSWTLVTTITTAAVVLCSWSCL